MDEATSVRTLIERLEATGRYKTLEAHVQWRVSTHEGEYDVLGTTHEGFRHYYEIKCRDTLHARAKATQQFERSYKYAPGGRRMKYIYVTEYRVARWRPGTTL